MTTAGIASVEREPCHCMRRPVRVFFLVLSLLTLESQAWAESFREPFETPVRSWQLHVDAPRQLLIEHRRQNVDAHGGQQAEFLQFDSPGQERAFGLIHDVPNTPLFGELKTSVWVKSNQPGVRLSMRIQCPRATHPRTGDPVVYRLHGETYSRTGEWQMLTCSASDDAVRERQTRLRAELIADGAAPDIDLSGAFVEQVELGLGLQPGATGLLIDDLEFGPLVSVGLPTAPTSGPAVSQRRMPGPLDLSGGHPRLNGHPWICRMVPYHGEPTDLLRKLQFNVVWLDRDSQADMFDSMQAADLWVSTSPPLDFRIASASPVSQWLEAEADNYRLASSESLPHDHGEARTSLASAPVAIAEGSEAVLFWNLGARIPPSELEKVQRAVQSVRQSDRLYDFPRPILGDVVSQDRRFSRQLDVTGSSVPLLHSSISPVDYFHKLRERSLQTLAGSPKSTWIATEPSPAVRTAVEDAAIPAVVEPEQIMLQADLALAAGYQAVNYWTRTSLADDLPGNEERRAAIELVNRQIELLEPWIATGEFVGVVPVSYVDNRSRRTAAQPPIVATIVQSEMGILLRLVYVGKDHQFVPGPMAAGKLKVVVRGAGEMPVAYGVTTTGTYAIEPTPVAGGTELVIENFDQSASIVVTGFRHQGLIDRLNKRIVATKADAADAWIRLASAKYARVVDTHERIQSVSMRPFRAGAVLAAEANVRLDRAQDAFEVKDFDQARQEAKFALDLLRRIQRTHWELAVQQVGSPHADVFTLCYDTLPAFWSQRNAGASAVPVPISLTAGSFEDGDLMRQEGWQNAPVEDAATQGLIELTACDNSGGRSIRLAAAEVEDAEELPRAVLVTPELVASPGTMIDVSFDVRSFDGRKPGMLRVSDSRLGPVVGLVETAPIGRWERKSVRRIVGDSGRIRFRFELLGSGVACVDNVTFSAIETQNGETTATEEPVEARPKQRLPLRVPKARDLLPPLPRIPSLNPWARDGETAEPEILQESVKDGEVSSTNGSSDTDPAGDEPLELPVIRPGHGL